MSELDRQPVALVMEPSTPKGVEHWMRSPSAYQSSVMEPSTPKGVEHSFVCRVPVASDQVMEPSTPKRVEHWLLPVPFGPTSGDGTFDAERR